VLAAPSADAAMALTGIPANEPTLLLTDVVLTGENGRQLAARMTSRFPRMRVLYVSGYDDNVIVREGLLEKDIAFLQKPLSATVLARRVRQLLDAG